MRPRSSSLLYGGTVRTGDPHLPVADWVRVEGGRVAEVGRGTPPEVPGAGRVDLQARTLIPAFHDAHVHLTWVATAILGCDLSACDSVDAVLQALASRPGPGRGAGREWIVGYGFDESLWRDARLPRRAELDAIESKRPVLLQRVCGHVGVVNSKALARATPGPFTDSDSGRLAEDDLYAVNDLLRPSAMDLERVLPQVASTLHAHGITQVHDVMPPEMLIALQTARRAGELSMRVSGSIPARYLRPATPGTSRVRGAEWFAARGLEDVPTDRTDDWLRILGIKLFLDGSLGARTAALRAPYADMPETRGSLLYSSDELHALAREIDAAGLQLMVHAIGDAALDQALEVLEPLTRAGNPQFHRLEHVEVTPDDLVGKLAKSGLHACLQPNFAARWSQPGGMNAQRLGNRLVQCNAYQALHAAGLPIAFGSDCMPLGPLQGLSGAIEHPLPRQRLDASVALDLYTRAGASLTHSDAHHGRIAPGYDADFALLSADPISGAPPGSIRVVATWLEGETVFEA